MSDDLIEAIYRSLVDTSQDERFSSFLAIFEGEIRSALRDAVREFEMARQVEEVQEAEREQVGIRIWVPHTDDGLIYPHAPYHQALANFIKGLRDRFYTAFHVPVTVHKRSTDDFVFVKITGPDRQVFSEVKIPRRMHGKLSEFPVNARVEIEGTSYTLTARVDDVGGDEHTFMLRPDVHGSAVWFPVSTKAKLLFGREDDWYRHAVWIAMVEAFEHAQAADTHRAWPPPPRRKTYTADEWQRGVQTVKLYPPIQEAQEEIDAAAARASVIAGDHWPRIKSALGISESVADSVRNSMGRLTWGHTPYMQDAALRTPEALIEAADASIKGTREYLLGQLEQVSNPTLYFTDEDDGATPATILATGLPREVKQYLLDALFDIKLWGSERRDLLDRHYTNLAQAQRAVDEFKQKKTAAETVREEATRQHEQARRDELTRAMPAVAKAIRKFEAGDYTMGGLKSVIQRATGFRFTLSEGNRHLTQVFSAMLHGKVQRYHGPEAETPEDAISAWLVTWEDAPALWAIDPHAEPKTQDTARFRPTEALYGQLIRQLTAANIATHYARDLLQRAMAQASGSTLDRLRAAELQIPDMIEEAQDRIARDQVMRPRYTT